MATGAVWAEEGSCGSHGGSEDLHLEDEAGEEDQAESSFGEHFEIASQALFGLRIGNFMPKSYYLAFSTMMFNLDPP